MLHVDTIKKVFPRAIPGPEFTRKVIALFQARGFTSENTVFANSTCPDEINRGVTKFGDHYGENFPMGGLAGFPFTGITGLGAFLHHVPDEGNVFILYGPHIGVSESGELGKIKRKGMTHETSSCGSLCAAYAALRKKWAKKEMVQLSFDPLDSQQGYVMSRLNACKNAIEWSANPHETVVKTAYGVIDEMMQKVFTDDRTKCSGAVAFVGGIQINTPHGHDDYFLPLNVELCGGKNKERISLLSEVLNS